MTSFQDRIVQVRGELERDEFGRRIGVSARTVQRWELEGGHPKGSELAKIAEVFGVDLHWLITGGEAPNRNTEPQAVGKSADQHPDCNWQPSRLRKQALSPPQLPDWTHPKSLDDFSMVPLAEHFLSPDGGAFILSEARDVPHAFRRQWLKRKTNHISNLMLLQVHGDCMEPALRHDDTIMVDRGRVSVVSGHIYAVGLEDNIMVKRVFRLPNDRIILRSDNPYYAPLNTDIKDVCILGEVIWLAREIA
jgi:phage repressor protein C with HTH and peptisase S24 domain